MKPALKASLVIITWITASEQNNSGFIVERSGDGTSFYPIARIDGSGNRNVATSYQSIDSFPLTGVNYYRLKQFDSDGTEAYSKVVVVNTGGNHNGGLNIFPNPVREMVQIRLNSSANNFIVSVSGVDGKLIFQGKGNFSQISEQINSNIKRLAGGLYILQFTSSTERYSVKFLKQ